MCEEKLFFWNACQDYHDIEDDLKRTAKAAKVYNTFLSDDGGMLVSVDRPTREEVGKIIRQSKVTPPDIFHFCMEYSAKYTTWHSNN